MILTTTPTIKGKCIREYRGIVTGEATLSVSVISVFHAADIEPNAQINGINVGLSACKKELSRARQLALDELAKAARQAGGDAVVGINLDHEVADHGQAVLVSANGTAVTIGALR